MRVFIFVTVLIGLASGAADPYAVTSKQITTLLSNFCTPAQIKTLTEWLLDQSYAGKTLQDVQGELVTQALNLLNNQQKAKATTMYSKMSNELGGTTKSQALLETLMTEVGAFVKPFSDKVQTVMAAQKKAKKAKLACKKAALTQANKFLTKANIQKAINNLKKKFNAKQCQIAFKYLAPTYVFLGKYSFMSPACSGKGV